MNGATRADDNRNALLEAFVVEFASAAYPVALEHGAGGTWVDLELGLRRVVTETIHKWDGVGHGDRAIGGPCMRRPPGGAPLPNSA